jgi:tryptophanyl-tRNA synthetase
MQEAYKNGIAWGDAKQILFERIDSEITPMREKYESLMGNPAQIEAILLKGADKARQIGAPFMQSLRQAVGLRGLGALQSTIKTDKKPAKSASASFKQYREADGKFYFKLLDAHSTVVLQSLGFETPQEAGAAIASIKEHGVLALKDLKQQMESHYLNNTQAIVTVLQQIKLM